MLFKVKVCITATSYLLRDTAEQAPGTLTSTTVWFSLYWKESLEKSVS